MTKGCVLLHADTHRLCKRSVTDRNYCEMFSIPVREVREAPEGSLQPSDTLGSGLAGGLWWGIMSLTFLLMQHATHKLYRTASKKWPFLKSLPVSMLTSISFFFSIS